MSHRQRAQAQPDGRKRKKPDTGGEGNYHHIGVRPKGDFVTFRTQDVGDPGHIQRVCREAAERLVGHREMADQQGGRARRGREARPGHERGARGVGKVRLRAGASERRCLRGQAEAEHPGAGKSRHRPSRGLAALTSRRPKRRGAPGSCDASTDTQAAARSRAGVAARARTRRARAGTGHPAGPRTGPPPGEPPPPKPGKPIPRRDLGMVDPRHLHPEPEDFSPGMGTPLEVEPLSGPTEASADDSAPAEPDGPGLVDPRSLAPGSGEPAPVSRSPDRPI
jgi:hypothetical protein